MVQVIGLYFNVQLVVVVCVFYFIVWNTVSLFCFIFCCFFCFVLFCCLFLFFLSPSLTSLSHSLPFSFPPFFHFNPAGGRTLGEEYCDLEPVSATGRPATRVRRAAFVALHVLVPYLFRRLRKHGRRVAVDADANIVTRSSAWLWNHIVSLALRSDAALVVAQRWHLAFFYLFGAYLHFARRGAGLRYLCVA